MQDLDLFDSGSAKQLETDNSSGLPRNNDMLSIRGVALGNVDILKEVFNHIGLGLEDQISQENVVLARTTLLNAARTYRTFLEPALSALWRVLPSLTPLFKLLPSFVRMNNKYVLLEVQPSHWAKFDQRAKDVQVLLLGHELHSISPFVYIRLQQLRNPVLPALRTLTILNDFNVSSPVPFLALSSSVASVDLRGNSVTNQEFFKPFVASVITEATSISCMSITGPAVDLSILPKISTLKALKLDVSHGCLSKSFMMALGALPSLNELTIRTGENVPPFADTPLPAETASSVLNARFAAFVGSIRPGMFISLRNLVVVGHPDATMVILAYVTPTSLRRLEIRESQYHARINFKNSLLDYLAKNAPKLRTVVMTQTSRDSWTIHPSTLLHSRNLEVLDLSEGGANINDEDIAAMRTSLPHLKTLHLPAICVGHCPSLKFIWTPQMLPPSLESLAISIYQYSDSQTESELPDIPNLIIPRAHAHRHLRHIALCSNFGKVEEIDIHKLAKLLNYSYPRLDCVVGYGFSEDCWERVDLVRSTLREVCETLEKTYIGNLESR